MKPSDEPSFFRAILDGRQYTYKYTTFAQLISTPRQLQEAAIVEILKLHAQNKDAQGIGPVDNIEQPLLVKEKRVKKKRPQTKDGYVKNTEVVNPYHKHHHSPTEEYQAATNIIGHTIIVYTENGQGHLQQENRFTPEGKLRGSPIVLVKSGNTFSLDIQRTKHWSLYGAIASLSESTAEQLYDLVGYRTRLRLDQTPQVELLKNQREYLEHHTSAIPPAINPHELETLATILKRPIRTNPIMSMGYDDTIRNTIRMTPPGWTGSTPDLVVLFAGKHYQTPHVSSQKNRPSTKTPPKPELRKDVDTLTKIIEEIPPTTAQVYHARRAPTQDESIPNEASDASYEREDLLDQVHEVQAQVESVESVADARRADVSVHNLARKVAEQLIQHHPDHLPMAMKQAKASPGLFRKLAKHTGSAVRSTGRTAKGVVDRSSLGDIGVFGIALTSGLAVLSSYTSVWRVFFGN
jgi:hypothetical protein